MPAADSPFFSPEQFTDPTRRQQAQHLHDHGYLVLPGLVSAGDTDAAQRETDGLFDPTRTDGPRSRNRCQDAWVESPATRRIAANAAVTEVIAELYGRRPFPFQTLTFRTGSEQRAHADTLHFNSFPARYLCAAWVALEDIDSSSGPLFYVPGSHRLPELRSIEVGSHPLEVDYDGYEDAVAEVIRRRELPIVEFEARRGDVFIWSANLLHGGMPVTDPSSTRWSQVTHYYFDGCVYYAPRYSDPLSGARHLRDVVDIRTGEPVPHRSDGHPVEIEPVDELRSRVNCPAWYPPRGARHEGAALLRSARRFAAATGQTIGRRLSRR